MKTEKKIQTEIIINSTKEKIWKILIDTDKYKEWNPFIVSMSGKIKEGERLVNVMKNGEGTITFKPKVLKVIENEYFEWMGNLIVPGLFDGQHYFKLEDIRPGQVKLTHGENFKGLFSGMILRKIGDETKTKFIAMNNAIKQKAEL